MKEYDGILMNVFEIYHNGKWKEQFRVHDDEDFICEVEDWLAEWGDEYREDDDEFTWRTDKEMQYFHDWHGMARISNGY